MIIYEGNITHEPTLKAWVRRTLRDNGPLSTQNIWTSLTFYEKDAVRRAVGEMARDNDHYLEHGKWYPSRPGGE